MQLVLCNNRVIAHGGNYLSMGGVVINTDTGAKYNNATIAECECCPSDINEVGYEYHAGVFVPCAPYGKGNNNGYFMEVCAECAAPRSSGIPIRGGLKRENFHPDFVANELGGTMITLLWENASPNSNFAAQKITLASDDWDFLICEATEGTTVIPAYSKRPIALCNTYPTTANMITFLREIEEISGNEITFASGARWSIGKTSGGSIDSNIDSQYAIPLKIYGVKI